MKATRWFWRGNFFRKAGIGVIALLLLSVAGSLFAGALDDYVKAPDDSFEWEVVSKQEVPATPPYTRYTLQLVSQTWHGFKWSHNLQIIVPAEYEHPETMMLVIGGGVNVAENGPPQGASTTEALVLPPIATRGRALVALLSQVPNQPILDGRGEDEAIAYSFTQFLQTQDDTWPLLLPMVKSAVKAMDALQEFSKQELGIDVQKFMVTGASKRGWTTWLTAAADSRVAAIAPLVIDNLNMRAQMPHQLEAWGKYSESISAYTDLNLPQQFSSETERGKQLMDIVDPYSYLDRLTMPKLVQSSTNDPYWVIDASHYYFPALKGEKYLHFSPNTAHDVDLGGIMSIGGFFHLVRSNAKRPTFDWQITSLTDGEVLNITHNDPPAKVLVWTADSPIRDFRKAQWHSVEIEHTANDEYRAIVNAPASGYRAYYAEIQYSEEGVPMGLCTEMRIIGGNADSEPVK